MATEKKFTEDEMRGAIIAACYVLIKRHGILKMTKTDLFGVKGNVHMRVDGEDVTFVTVDDGDRRQ